MQVAYWKKKTLLQLGKFVAAQHPDLAKVIVHRYLHSDAIDENLDNIPAYYAGFLAVCPSTVEVNSSYAKRLFISVMLRIYSPGVYEQPPKDLVMRQGLVVAVSKTVSLNQGYLSRCIRSVIVHEKVYEDYREQVLDIVERLTGKAKAC